MTFFNKHIFPITLLLLGSQKALADNLTLVCENGTSEYIEKSSLDGKPTEPFTPSTTRSVDDAVITIAEDECVIQLGKRSGVHPLIEFGEANIICGSTAERIYTDGKSNTNWDLIINRLNGKLVFKSVMKYQTDFGYFNESTSKTT